jgi:ATP-dependent DNA helicase RecG
LKANGSPRAIVVTDEERTFFRITIPCHEAAGNIIADIANKDNHDPKGDPKGDLKELSERQSLMLDLIMSDDLITIHQMTQKINVSEKTIKRELAFLQEKGILTREGGRKEGKWVVLIEE